MYSLLGNSWYVVGEFFAHPRTHQFAVIASIQKSLPRTFKVFLASPLSIGSKDAYVPKRGAAINMALDTNNLLALLFANRLVYSLRAYEPKFIYAAGKAEKELRGVKRYVNIFYRIYNGRRRHEILPMKF